MNTPLGSRAAVNPMMMMEELAAQGSQSHVPLKDVIVVEGFNPRNLLSSDAFTDVSLEDLAASIREQGILQPLLVRKVGKEIQLIAGERRLKAARLAKLTSVPVVFIEADDQRAYEIAIIENAQRKDLDLVTETLVGFEFLSRKLGLSVDDVVTYLNAVRKGRRDDTHGVEGLLRSVYGTGIGAWSVRRSVILKMLPEEHRAIREGVINARVCAELVGLPAGEVRSSLLGRAVDEGLSAEQLQALVRAISKPEEAEGRSFRTRVDVIRKKLPDLARLKGKDAERAEKLLGEIERKLGQLLAAET
jgi:ParB family chromosome partitioning protein